jgi:hypothetical protein
VNNNLTEQNSWKVLFYENVDEFYEGYLFGSKEDALKAALEFCKQMSPKKRSELIKVNADKLVLGARNSTEYVVIKPPDTKPSERLKKKRMQR